MAAKECDDSMWHKTKTPEEVASGVFLLVAVSCSV